MTAGILYAHSKRTIAGGLPRSDPRTGGGRAQIWRDAETPSVKHRFVRFASTMLGVRPWPVFLLATGFTGGKIDRMVNTVPLSGDTECCAPLSRRECRSPGAEGTSAPGACPTCLVGVRLLQCSTLASDLSGGPPGTC